MGSIMMEYDVGIKGGGIRSEDGKIHEKFCGGVSVSACNPGPSRQNEGHLLNIIHSMNESQLLKLKVYIIYIIRR